MPRHEVVDAELCQVSCLHPQDVARARSGLADDNTYRDLAELFAALADPSRARIVHALVQQELCSCDIAALAGISPSGASQHLRVLRHLRLVKSRRVGKLIFYSLDDAHIALLIQLGLTHLGHGDVSADPGPLAPVLVGAELG
jgi:DNA-binding transcriptional ArsR family regulator